MEGINMTEGFFWTVSAICLIVSILLTAFNIFITRSTSLKVSRINQKLNVDFKMHEALINQIVIFLATIDERKMRVLNSMSDDPSQLVMLKNNQEEMDIAYNKLILLLNYSITDFEEVRKRLKLLMEKYNRIYELLSNGLYKMQMYNTYPEDRKIDVSGLKKQSDEMINECTDLLGDKRLDGVFMSGINHFIRKEVHAIREFSIKL